MKFDTVPSRSPCRLYTAVPSTLLDEIRRSVSSTGTLPAAPPLGPEPEPDVGFSSMDILRSHFPRTGIEVMRIETLHGHAPLPNRARSFDPASRLLPRVPELAGCRSHAETRYR